MRSAAGLLLLLVLFPAAGPAQTVRIVFVGPTDALVAAFGAANVFGGYADGYRGVDITKGSLEKFAKIAPPAMVQTRRQLERGTVLRERLDRMLAISGGVVDLDILLADDRRGFSGDTGTFVTATAGDKTYVWPAASCQPKEAGRYRGIVRLGETASLIIQSMAGGWPSWEAFILHEVLHTQFLNENVHWGPINILHGAAPAHRVDEVAASDSLSVEEGLAAFYGSMHNDPVGLLAVLYFLGRTDPRYTVAASGFWLDHDQPAASTPGLPQPGSYPWSDVSALLLLHSESTVTAFYLLFWENADDNTEQALAMIDESARFMALDRSRRSLPYAVSRLALQLEEFAATAEGRDAQTAGMLTSSLFPFALLDLLTRFGMTEQQYELLYELPGADRRPQAYARYWERREEVKELLAPYLSSIPIPMDAAAAALNRYCQELF
jgi:hypothetical protein